MPYTKPNDMGHLIFHYGWEFEGPPWMCDICGKALVEDQDVVCVPAYAHRACAEEAGMEICSRCGRAWHPDGCSGGQCPNCSGYSPGA